MKIRRIYIPGKKESEENKRLLYVPTTLAEVVWASETISNSPYQEGFELPYLGIHIRDILEGLAKQAEVSYRQIVERIIEDEAEFMPGRKIKTAMMVWSVLDKEEKRGVKPKQEGQSSYSNTFMEGINSLERMIAFAANDSRQGRPHGYRNFVEIVYPEDSLRDMWSNGKKSS